MTDQNSPEDLPALAHDAHRRFTLTVWIVFGGILLYFLIHNLSRIHRQNHLSDFSVFYAAADAMVHGRDIYPLAATSYYVYPPLIAFLYQPLARLTPHAAAGVSLTISVLLAAWSIVLASREMGRRFETQGTCARVAFAALCTLLLTFGRLKAELSMQQTDVLILIAYTLAFVWIDRRPLAAGVVLGFALNIKYLTFGALPYLLMRRRWKAAGAFVAASIFWALLPATTVGLSTDLRYLRVATAGILGSVGVSTDDERAHVHNVTDSLHISATSGIARVLATHGLPIGVAGIAIVMIFLAFVGAVALIYRHNRLPLFAWPKAKMQMEQPFRALVALEWAGIIVVSLAFGPTTNTRHLVLLAVYIAAGCALLLAPVASPRQRQLAAIALAITYCGIETGLWARHDINTVWSAYGGQGWAMLAAYLVLLAAGMTHIASRTQRD